MQKQTFDLVNGVLDICNLLVVLRSVLWCLLFRSLSENGSNLQSYHFLHDYIVSLHLQRCMGILFLMRVDVRSLLTSLIGIFVKRQEMINSEMRINWDCWGSATLQWVR